MSNRKKNLFHFGLSEFVFIFFVLFSGVMLSFSSKSFVVNFSELGFAVLSSVQENIKYVISKTSGAIESVKELSRLKSENAVLNEKLKNYEYMQRSNADIRRENDRLRKLLDYSATVSRKNYPAEIIGRDIDSLYSYIMVNKGSKHGIKRNFPVIAIQNGNTGIVGKVVEVGYTTCQIMPVYSVYCSVSSRIQNTRDVGIVTGAGDANGMLIMRYIKKRVLEDLHYGDIVVSSGENDNYVKDVPVGTISKITVVDYDSSLNIELVPSIDFSRLEDVIIVDLKNLNDMQAE